MKSRHEEEPAFSGLGQGLPSPGEGRRGETGYLGYLLRQAAGAYRHRVDHRLLAFGITQPQFVVLTMLAAYPGISNADLARMALLSPQTLSVIVVNLRKAGLLSREPHAVHGRIHRLHLTEAGRAVLAEARTQVHQIEDELTAGLPPEDLRAIRRWMIGVARLKGGTTAERDTV